MFYKPPKQDYEKPPFQTLFLMVALVLLAFVFYTNRNEFTPDRQKIMDSLGIRIVPVPSENKTASEQNLNKKTDNPDSHNNISPVE
jgi:predicted alternative tryptophan synthase beta-subunit